MLALACTVGLYAQSPSNSTREYQIKAAFLYNFTQFVEWPKSSFTGADAPIIIGVLGENPFGKTLEQLSDGEKVNGRPLIVKYFDNVDKIIHCHILFINAQNLEQLSALKGKGTLLVSDAPAFLENGGMIKFFKKENRLKFQINLEATQTENLKISSKLLNMASIY